MKIIKNSDADIVKEIDEHLKLNDGYCSCSLEKTPETKCMCKEFLESKTLGKCHCGKYIKVEL